MRSEARVEAACLTSNRAGVLAMLKKLARPVTVDELATLLGQHRNTVRRHLDELVTAKLVVAQRSTPVGRGRPPLIYAVNRAALEGEPEYAQLAALLAGHLAESGGSEIATRLGQEWGERLIAQAEQSGEPIPDPLTLLEELGFAPTVDESGHEIHLRRCPLLSASSLAPDVVCVMHSTMVARLFAAHGLDVHETEIYPFDAPGECRLHIGPDTVPRG